MPSCVMRYCTNYTSKTSKSQGITYHSFPTNELKCIEWAEIVRKQRNEEFWQPNKWSRVCSIHFKDEDKYTSSKGYTLLKNSAVPIVDVCPEQPMPGSPNSLTEEHLSDSESIFETPREAALRRIVDKITLEKEELVKKNRNLKCVNKRLRIRVAHLKDKLKQLKTKKNISQEQSTEMKTA